MRFLNRPHAYTRLITPPEDARRQASASETLKKCEKQAYVLKALWGVRTKIKNQLGTCNRSKQEQIPQFESIQVPSSDPIV
jgi:hypothetical protein